jgi:hypothetical protein
MNEQTNSKFKPAVRTSVKPLIGLFGESGGGKTYSALLLARGIVGPNGKIGLVDTENGRGSLFCDMIQGGYETLEIQPPFSPEAYIQAIDEAESAGIECLIIDSTSHEWNGQGGYLDMKEAALDRMAGNDWKKRDACKFAASAQCKPSHNKFVSRLLRCKMAVILCFRAKEKVKMEKDERGKTAIKSDEHVSPISDSGLIFEMLIAGEVYARDAIGGYFRCIKYTHTGLLSAMPKEDKQIGVDTGEIIAKWCKGEKPAEKPLTFKAQTWSLVRAHYNDNAAAFESGLKAIHLLAENETLASLTEDRWKSIFTQLSEHPSFKK